MYIWRVRLIYLFFTIAFVALSARAVHVMITGDNPQKADIMIASRGSTSLYLLEKHNAELIRLIENIENYPLSEIKNFLGETVRLTKNANADISAQVDSWSNLKSDMRIDSETYSELSLQLQQIKKLQDKEIMRLEGILQEARKPSFFETFSTYIFSFLLGVMTSLLGNILYNIFVRNRRQ